MFPKLSLEFTKLSVQLSSPGRTVDFKSVDFTGNKCNFTHQMNPASQPNSQWISFAGKIWQNVSQKYYGMSHEIDWGFLKKCSLKPSLRG